MRRIVWNGAVLITAAGAGFFLVANYASRHPDSLIARCTNVVYKVDPACEDDSELCIPDEPHPIEEIFPEQPVPVASLPMTEPLDVTHAGHGALESAPVVACPGESECATVVPEAIKVLPTVIELESDPYKVMPRCDEDEAGAARVMPYAVDNATSTDESEHRKTLRLWNSSWETGSLKRPVQFYAMLDFLAGQEAAVGKGQVKQPANQAAESDEQELGSKPAMPESKRRSSIPLKPSQILLQAAQPGEEGRPVQPRIDTTEYRPSDAKRGEFGPIPF